MMLARILRLVVVLAIVAVVLVLFAYAFLAALIVVPILALLLFLFGRRYGNIWVIGMPAGFEEPGPRREPHGGRAPPVIDHDPNDLPPTDRPENER